MSDRKGHKNEQCNVTSCETNLPAIWMHHHNNRSDDQRRAWYCDNCAHDIAQACRNDGFKLFDFMPDVKTEDVRLASDKDT